VVRLESARNPRGEAEALLAAALAAGPADTVVVLGGGGGAVLETVAAHGLRALVIEFDAELATGWLARRSWTDLIQTDRLRLLIGPDYVGSAEAARFVEGAARLPVIAQPVLIREYAGEMADARRALDRVVRDARANANARGRFEDLALTNTLRNLPALAAGADAGALFGRFAGTPAVVVGAGPSLDENLGAIRKVQDRALVIATDTALLPCLKAGVVPPIVVALDPSEANGRHLVACAAATETHLVTELSVDPTGVAAFAGRTFTFRVGDHAPWPWLVGAGIDRARLSVWGSVATAALDLALKAGCPAVAFAGLDLAYTGGRPYCRGTYFEELWAWEIVRGTTLSDYWEAMRTGRPVVAEPDVHGHTTASADHLLAFRDWIREVAAAHRAVRFANATGAGVLHGPRIAQQALADFLSAYPTVGRRALGATVRRAFQASVDGGLAARIAALLVSAQPAALVKGHSASGRAADAVGTASLDDLRRGLEGTPPAPAPAPMGSPFATVPRIHLPEQTSLLRALATGAGSPPAHPDPAAAAERLRDAHRQLLELVGPAHGVAVRREAGDVLASWHQVPARLLFAWPRALADAVEAFGSTLSDALRLAGRPATAPAFDLPLPGDSRQCERAVDRSRPLDGLSESQLAPSTLVWQWTLARTLTAGTDEWLTRTVLTLLHAPPGIVPANRPATRLTAWLCDGPAAAARLPFLPGLSAVRALTGLIASDARAVQTRDGGEASLEVSLSETGDDRLATVCTIEPESLLARGHPRAHRLAARSEREVLAGRLDGSGIDVVTDEGRLAGVETWPLPARASIPLGAAGRLAWHYPDSPRLLHRDLATSRVDVVDLPFTVFDALERPDGSVCLATDDGLWSWRPGAPPQPLVRGVWLALLYPHGNGVRAFARPARSDGGRWDATTQLLQWQPGATEFRRIPVAAGTAPSSIAERRGWRAEAWLDGCVVRLVRADDRVFWLACSGPLSLAWAGTSLFASTTAGEVLRFPDLATRLEAL
jgi:hypothetical protein